MRRHLFILIPIVLAVSSCFVSFSQATDLFDTISKSLSDAGDAIVETSESIVDSAKEVGEDIGILEKEEPEKKAPQQKAAGSKTASTSAPQKSTVEKLPGGVTSRLKNMYKELDKVESKLVKGAGTDVDRANRAKLDLKRAQGYMTEIEKRYKDQYSPEHPEMVAAVKRLEEVTLACRAALGEANEKQADVARQEEDKKAVKEKTPEQAPESSKIADTTAAQSGVVEKLPGGVTSRLKKMYKDLDKVEIKLSKGAGTDVDRANRAKSDLKRAQGYMIEIEKRYKGQYSPEHPEIVTAVTRLEEVTLAHQVALGEATEKQAELARQAKEQNAAQQEKILQAKKEEQRNLAAKQAAKQNKEAMCTHWLKSIEQHTYGDKTVSGYDTDDQQLLKTWKGYYDDAQVLLKDYRAEVTPGECSNADSAAILLDSKMAQFSEFYQSAMAKQSQAKKNMGQFVFSSVPIIPGKTVKSTSDFKAGDYIYGIVEVVKPWSEIYKKKNNFDVMINIKIDGKKIHSQFIKLKTEDYAAGKSLVFNVAPELENLVAYTDTNIEYGKSTPVIRQGPNELTYHLAKLSPGKHSITFLIQYYGTTWAEGNLTISGKNFDKYADLHKQIAEGVVSARTFPEAKLVNKNLEKEMVALLKNSGWSNVYRLNIVDKDWWIERMSGGNSPVKAKYIAAAALTKGDDGNYFYKHCTFHQDKLITGAFGPLYLSHQGEAVPIVKKNIDN